MSLFPNPPEKPTPPTTEAATAARRALETALVEVTAAAARMRANGAGDLVDFVLGDAFARLHARLEAL